jgi:hypothetical protein
MHIKNNQLDKRLVLHLMEEIFKIQLNLKRNPYA